MASDELELFGRWLKQRREALDLTQKELADVTGCSLSTIRKLEMGLRRPSKQVAELLAAGLRIESGDYTAFMRFAREGRDGQTVGEPPPLPTAGSTADAQTPALSPTVRSQDAEQAIEQRTETPAPPTNLPYYPTSFIGRQKVLEQVVGLLWRVDVRLLTLTGPPGVGKTRLAIQSGAQLLEDFADGVFFVPLASLSNPALVVQAVAHSFGLRESKGSSLLDTLIEYLGRKQLLLIVDNFEQVVEGAAVLSDILRAAPRLKILATSRFPLELYGEHEFVVPPLALPQLASALESPEPSEAVELFVRRSQAVQPDFALSPINNQTVAEITRKLEGLPLAIELAAVRSRYYDPETMLALLQHRLGVLTGGPRDLPARHKTLRSAIAWSYDLLDSTEQAFFRRLGVFSGGFTPAAAQAVAGNGLLATGYEQRATGDVMLSTQHSTLSTESSELGTLESLADKSLVTRGEGPDGVRYGLLETIREYALEQLEARGEEEETRGRHAAYYRALVREGSINIPGPDMGLWLEREDADRDNLRSALAWCIEGGETDRVKLESALGIVVAMYDFWDGRGHFSEGREWFARAIGSAERAGFERGSENEKIALARALANAGLLAWNQGDNAFAEQLYERSYRRFSDIGDHKRMGALLNNMAILAMERGDHERARPLYREAMEHAQIAGEKVTSALALNNLGVSYWELDEVEQAQEFFEQGLALQRELDEKWGMAMTLDNLGLIALYQNNFTTARRHLDEALALCRELDHKNNLSHVLLNSASLATAEGRYADSAGLLREGLLLARNLGYTRVLIKAVENVGELSAKLQQPLSAARLWAAGEAQREAHDFPPALPGRERHKQTIAAAREMAGPDRFDEAWREGRAMPLDEAAEVALDALNEADVLVTRLLSNPQDRIG